MQIVTAHQGILRTIRADGLRGKPVEKIDAIPGIAGDGSVAAGQRPARPAVPGAFCTGLELLDAAAPGGAFELGVVHELLYPPKASPPRSFALWLAIAAARARGGPVIWSDPAATLYPPAIARAGLPLDRLLILRPRSAEDELWAATQCMRCRGVAATIVEPGRLNRVQARRLQLAAETGGGAGFVLRSQKSATDYAAATRWLVRPEPSWERGRPRPPSPSNDSPSRVSGTAFERAGTPALPEVQRWRVELVHGHGGRLRQAIILEVSREVLRRSEPDGVASEFPAPHPVRAFDPVADRPGEKGPAARTA